MVIKLLLLTYKNWCGDKTWAQQMVADDGEPFFRVFITSEIVKHFSFSLSHSISGKCHYWHPDLVSNLGGIFASKLSQVHLRGRILRLIGSKPVTQDRLHIFLLILTLTTSLYTYQTPTLVSAIRKTSSLNVWMYECMLMWTIMYGGNQWPQERGLRK